MATAIKESRVFRISVLIVALILANQVGALAYAGDGSQPIGEGKVPWLDVQIRQLVKAHKGKVAVFVKNLRTGHDRGLSAGRGRKNQAHRSHHDPQGRQSSRQRRPYRPLHAGVDDSVAGRRALDD